MIYNPAVIRGFHRNCSVNQFLKTRNTLSNNVKWSRGFNLSQIRITNKEIPVFILSKNFLSGWTADSGPMSNKRRPIDVRIYRSIAQYRLQ